MKLELKYLAPYLPYKLKITFEGDEHEHELVGLDITSNGVKLLSPFSNYGSSSLEESKPLLHPLSRLTEPVLKYGKRIRDLGSPYDRPGSEYFELVRRVELSEKYNTPTPNEPYQTIVGTIEHWFVEKLLEWHFDVFGLIEKGLAEPIEPSKAKGSESI